MLRCRTDRFAGLGGRILGDCRANQESPVRICSPRPTGRNFAHSKFARPVTLGLSRHGCRSNSKRRSPRHGASSASPARVTPSPFACRAHADRARNAARHAGAHGARAGRRRRRDGPLRRRVCVRRGGVRTPRGVASEYAPPRPAHAAATPIVRAAASVPARPDIPPTHARRTLPPRNSERSTRDVVFPPPTGGRFK